MIFISTAMYHEAKPFISHYGLSRDNNIKRFQVFKGEDMLLFISGVGIVPSTIAVTYILTKFNVKPHDLFINIGVCAAKSKGIKIGTPILCHKIIDNDTKRSFYPDILFKHFFQEGVLETFSNIVNREMIASIEGDIVDMEGSGVYQAASTFLSPHQIYLIKIVSDYLDLKGLTPEDVSQMIQDNMPVIDQWLCNRINAYKLETRVLTEEEERYIERLCENLRLSTTMEHQIIKYAKQYKIRNGNIINVIKPYLSIKCKSKNEGKMYFERLKKQFIGV